MHARRNVRLSDDFISLTVTRVLVIQICAWKLWAVAPFKITQSCISRSMNVTWQALLQACLPPFLPDSITKFSAQSQQAVQADTAWDEDRCRAVSIAMRHMALLCGEAAAAVIIKQASAVWNVTDGTVCKLTAACM